MKLYNSLRAVILEVANRNEALNAIKNKKITTIYYEGDTINNPGWRTIEPVCAGTTKRNNPVLRAWQTEGVTDTEIPGWKFFRLDRIRNWQQTMDDFDEVRPNYNPNGDKSMNQVWLNAKFN
tara:strand:- start:477 stop:842 length:366 start_codon:yes stop_codon:yes gene_type:complete